MTGMWPLVAVAWTALAVMTLLCLPLYRRRLSLPAAGVGAVIELPASHQGLAGNREKGDHCGEGRRPEGSGGAHLHAGQGSRGWPGGRGGRAGRQQQVVPHDRAAGHDLQVTGRVKGVSRCASATAGRAEPTPEPTRPAVFHVGGVS